MKIEGTYLRDASMRISLDESERFDITYEGWSRTERGTLMQIQSMKALYDPLDGEVSFLAKGTLYRKDGTLGGRERDTYLTIDQVPETAKTLVLAEANRLREQILSATPTIAS